MAPKRAAKKAAPPPPPPLPSPPPPAESSDETRSGSRSRSEESEDEDAIGESPVPAATPAPKSTPAPAQNGDQSESSGEEEEEDEEEEGEGEDDQPAPAAPKNQLPPPQKKEDSDTSGDEDDNEEEEEEPTRAAPPSVPKKQPPQPRKKGDSDTSGDDEEEEAPPKPAPKKDAAALKHPAPAAAGNEAKKPGGFHRIWSTDDDVRILEALAAHQKQHGAFPQPDALVDVLAGKLDNAAYGSKELQSKVKSLRQRYLTLSKRGEVPSKEHDRRVLDLSKIVWDGEKTTTAAASNGHGQKGFEEMCELYPYLAEEVKKLEAARPGMCKREFGKMEDDKARAMDEKIKKQRVVQMRMEMRSADLTKEVTKAFMDLIDG